MTEREMRDIVTSFLDKAVRKVVLPVSFGVGLALAGGCGDDTTPAPKYAAPYVEASVPLYAAPFDGGVKADAGLPQADGGAVALYAAPFEAGVRYAAPFEAGAAVDSGSVALYAAPFDTGVTSDAGSAVLYAAPFVDSGMVVKYAAPMKDGGTEDGGPAILYAAPFGDGSPS